MFSPVITCVVGYQLWCTNVPLILFLLGTSIDHYGRHDQCLCRGEPHVPSQVTCLDVRPDQVLTGMDCIRGNSVDADEGGLPGGDA
jgi:hypothetical protein